jgi:hypothetical protein
VSTKLPQDASSSQKGNIYQYYLVIEYMQGLTKGHSIYIERYGDISLENQQIEVKNYNDDLTDMHENFWKTLKNWLNKDFNHKKYDHLLLVTTQSIGKKSNFKDWNHKKCDQKFDILKKISQNAGNSQSQIAKIITEVFNINTENLKQVLEKFKIINNAPGLSEYFDLIKDKVAKHIPGNLRDHYVSSLLGYILTPKIIEEYGWEVTFDEYASYCEILTTQFHSNTKFFPDTYQDKYPSHKKKLEYESYLFTKKIKDIKYNEVLNEAMTQYYQTACTIMDDFGRRELSKNLIIAYENNLIDNYNPKYRKHSRNTCTNDILKDSKNFYDELFSEQAQPFANFNNTPPFFRNGIYHILADDSKKKIKWKLEIKEDEQND